MGDYFAKCAIYSWSYTKWYLQMDSLYQTVLINANLGDKYRYI